MNAKYQCFLKLFVFTKLVGMSQLHGHMIDVVQSHYGCSAVTLSVSHDCMSACLLFVSAVNQKWLSFSEKYSYFSDQGVMCSALVVTGFSTHFVISVTYMFVLLFLKHGCILLLSVSAIYGI